MKENSDAFSNDCFQPDCANFECVPMPNAAARQPRGVPLALGLSSLVAAAQLGGGRASYSVAAVGVLAMMWPQMVSGVSLLNAA